MEPKLNRPCTAFADSRKIASGEIKDVALKIKEHLKRESKSTILIFDNTTSEQIEIDLRGSPETVVRRLEALAPVEAEKKAGPGRPKLGVVAREVTLLPQHWDWLALQPGGASVTLRKLVEDARKKNQSKDQIRQAQDATYKFMTVMAGDLPNFEEALRSLYAKDRTKFTKQIADWPKDVREHVQGLSKDALRG